MLIYYIVDIFSLILQAVVACICLNLILSFKFKLVFNICIFSFLYTLYYILYAFFGMTSEIRFLSSYFVEILLFVLIINDKLIYKMFAYTIYILVTQMADFLASLIITGIYGSYENVTTLGVPRVIGSAIYNVLYLSLCILAIVFWKLVVVKGKASKDIFVLITIPISQIFLLYGNFSAYIEKKEQMLVFTLSGMAISIVGYIFVFRINKKLIHKTNLENRLKQLEQNQLLKLEHIKEIDILDKHNKSFHHDIKSQLSVIQILLSNSENAQALEMLKTLSSDIHAYDNLNYCGHPVVNAVMCKKSVIASDFGIDMNIEVYINENTVVKSIDLCSIFSNLIDNAIEACNNIIDSSLKKYIDVKAGLKQEYLIIKISNSKSNEIKVIDGKIVTSKPDFSKHGLGLSIVKEIALKYEGAFSTNYSENEFIATVLLNTKCTG